MLNNLHAKPLFWSAPSPFEDANKRLKITLDTKRLTKLSCEEEFAYNIVRELGRLPQFELLGFEDDSLPSIKVCENNNTVNIEVIVNYSEDNCRKTWFDKNSIYSNYRCNNKSSDEYSSRLCLEAHRALNQDIFVTFGELLNTDLPFLVNVMSPTKLLKIIGLLLRENDEWPCFCKIGQITVDNDFFYKTLFRLKVSNFRGVLTSEGELTAEDIFGRSSKLTNVILDRGVRLLEIKDEIARQFYGGQGSKKALYHFDYFMLLAAGMLDAQARLLHCKLNLTGNSNYFSFNKEKSVLKFKDKYSSLYGIFQDVRVKNLIDILYKLRNTIHSSGHELNEQNGLTLISISSEVDLDLWSLLKPFAEKKIIGVEQPREFSVTLNGVKQESKQRETVLEPYNFVSWLLCELFLLCDTIYEAFFEEVGGLIEVDDDKLTQRMKKRFIVLG